MNTQGGSHDIALEAASMGGYYAIVQVLLKKGADANVQEG